MRDRAIHEEPKTSVVLLSGGLDSAVCLALADAPVVALAIDYGQPHAEYELRCACRIACAYFAELVEIRIEIPSAPAAGDQAMFWPGRNLILLSLAAALAQTRGVDTVVIGANRDDHRGYPDCRPEFLRAAAPTLGITIDAPLLTKTKQQIGAMARELDVPVADTWSCYFPTSDGRPCDACDACAGRATALA